MNISTVKILLGLASWCVFIFRYFFLQEQNTIRRHTHTHTAHTPHTHRTHILMLRIKNLLLRFCSKFIKFSSIRTEMYFVRAGYLLTQNTHTWFNTCHAVTKSLRSEKKEKKNKYCCHFYGPLHEQERELWKFIYQAKSSAIYENKNEHFIRYKLTNSNPFIWL